MSQFGNAQPEGCGYGISHLFNSVAAGLNLRLAALPD
jgi:hypothetical protein